MTKRRIAIAGVVLLLLGAQVTIVVPGNVVTKAQQLCEQLRKDLRARSMTNPECAQEFFRRGLRDFAARKIRDDARSQAQDTARAELDQFDQAFPVQLDIAMCGDGVVDTEFGEQCDDANQDNGDGCSGSCQNE